MLRLSKLADYSTAIMAHLARHTDDVCNAKEIANDTYLTVATVSKLLKLLTSKGLLLSQRGAQGGYLLALPATNISLTRIIEAVEGDLCLTACSHEQGQCTIKAFCHVKNNWQSINRAIHNALDQVSLAEFASTHPIETNINVEQIKRDLLQRSAQAK